MKVAFVVLFLSFFALAQVEAGFRIMRTDPVVDGWAPPTEVCGGDFCECEDTHMPIDRPSADYRDYTIERPWNWPPELVNWMESRCACYLRQTGEDCCDPDYEISMWRQWELRRCECTSMQSTDYRIRETCICTSLQDAEYCCVQYQSVDSGNVPDCTEFGVSPASMRLPYTPSIYFDYFDWWGAEGDPHLKSWNGEWFDYHGQCDLKLMHVPVFDGRDDMDIHIRTTIRYDYSYIEAAALKIGEDILEVGSFGSYAINGIEGAMKPNGLGLPAIAGYTVVHTQVNEKKHSFDVIMGNNMNISITTFKDWVGVQIINGKKIIFNEASGLIGTPDGGMLARNGTNLRENINALGQDWQVKEDEPVLFRTIRAPQAPEPCILPDPETKSKRRLGENAIAKADAEEACAHFDETVFAFCVHDVMVSGDLDAAQNIDF